MKPFSERYGFVKAREALQVQELDKPTKAQLWNILAKYLPLDRHAHDEVYSQLFHEVLKLPAQNWPYSNRGCWEHLASLFVLGDLPELFDVTECTVKYVSSHRSIDGRFLESSWIVNDINHVLTTNGVGWRMAGDNFVPAVEEEQLESIDTALENASLSKGARAHIADALAKFREPGATAADIIRDAISAVEAEVRERTGKDTLGRGLDALKPSHPKHKDLLEAFQHLYWYASDEKGVRHAKIDFDTNATLPDAMFMIVACSAFVTWLAAHE